MKLILFLGAGVSIPSGLPSAETLTKGLFSTALYYDGEQGFAPCVTKPDRNKRDETRRIQKLLALIRRHDERDIKRVGYYPVLRGFRSSGAIYRGHTTYEDLYFLCQQISLWNHGLSDNSLATPFMECIEAQAGRILTGRTTRARISHLATLGQRACFFIESFVAQTLCQRYRSGFDQVLNLATSPQIEQLNIVTLNHDTLVEQFLRSKDISYVDGFGPDDGDVRWFDDGIFDAPNARVKILKLHGSIDWYSFLVDGNAKYGSFSGEDPRLAKDSNQKQLLPRFRRPSFLSGINKAVGYYSGIYGDIHFRFRQACRECQNMIVSGYGWGDTAINLALDSWLDKHSGNKMIYFDEKIEQMKNKSLIMATGFDSRIQSGQLLPINRYLCDARLEDLNLS